MRFKNISVALNTKRKKSIFDTYETKNVSACILAVWFFKMQKYL